MFSNTKSKSESFYILISSKIYFKNTIINDMGNTITALGTWTLNMLPTLPVINFQKASFLPDFLVF